MHGAWLFAYTVRGASKERTRVFRAGFEQEGAGTCAGQDRTGRARSARRLLGRMAGWAEWRHLKVLVGRKKKKIKKEVPPCFPLVRHIRPPSSAGRRRRAGMWLKEASPLSLRGAPCVACAPREATHTASLFCTAWRQDGFSYLVVGWEPYTEVQAGGGPCVLRIVVQVLWM